MLDRVKVKFDLHPERLIADTAYGSGPMLGWLVDRKIAPHIPVMDQAGRHCQIKIICYALCADLGLVSIADVWRKPIKYRDLSSLLEDWSGKGGAIAESW